MQGGGPFNVVSVSMLTNTVTYALLLLCPHTQMLCRISIVALEACIIATRSLIHTLARREVFSN